MWLNFLFLVLQLSSNLCEEHGNASSINHEEYLHNSCPLWFDHGNGECYCKSESKHKDRIRCDNESRSIKVVTGNCLTWDDHTNTTLLTDCPYFSKESTSNATICHHYTYTVPSTVTHSDLNSFVCSQYHRQGLHCGECIDGYGPAPFLNGANISCAKCSKNNFVWIAYLILHLFMVAIIYFTFLFCEIRGTASPLNVLAYFHQILINAVTSNQQMYAQIICNMHQMGPVNIMLTLFSFWNLDFFRFTLPPVCVSPSLSNADILLFDYIVALFPVLLTALSYVLIQLHDKGLPLIVCLWRPFRLLIARYKEDWNPRKSILNTFITFLLLSYSKFLFTSANLLYGVHVYNNDYEIVRESPVLYYDTSMAYLGRKHIVYITLSLFIVVVFVILPPVLLLLYLTRCFKRCLERCKFRRWNTLNIIMDVFQGWYKDGTNETKDYRALSAIYMILRFGFASEFILVKLFQYRTAYSSFEWTLPSLIHIALGCFYLTAKPYKKNWMNVVDGLVLILLGTMVVLSGFEDDYTLVLVLPITCLPSLVVLTYLFCKLFKLLKIVDHLQKLCKRFHDCIQQSREKREEMLKSASLNTDDRFVQSDESDFASPSLLPQREVHSYGSIQESSIMIEYGT